MIGCVFFVVIQRHLIYNTRLLFRNIDVCL